MTGRDERHSLLDWLALHELDPAACQRILDEGDRVRRSRPRAAQEIASASPGRTESASGSQALDPEAAWLRTADAMRAFFPAQRSIVDDTLEKTTKVLVARRNKSRRALTLDNGPATYPTIFYSYLGQPSDALVISHEFAHAVQIRASRGRFVSPIMRETCAFIGELTLLSHAQAGDAAQHRDLSHAWHKDNRKYLGTDKDKLGSALSQPELAYTHAWNYPIARYLAIRIWDAWSRDRMWALFEGDLSVGEALRALDLEPSSS